MWKKEKELHINLLEFKAAKLILSTFIKLRGKSIKTPWTKSFKLNKTSQEVWKFLISNTIMINTKPLWVSHHVLELSEWKLNTVIFRAICKIFWSAKYRSFCFSPDKTNGVLHSLESRPILKMSMGNPFLLLNWQNLIQNSPGKLNPLIKTKNLRLAAWLFSDSSWQQRECLKGVEKATLNPEGKEISQFANLLGNGLVGVTSKKLIHFNVLQVLF